MSAKQPGGNEPPADLVTVTQLEEQIFQKEGFRVSFSRFDAAADRVPSYGFAVMAPNGWHLADWKRARLGEYIMLFKGITVFRGDGSPVVRDVRVGHLRDTYYAAAYGSSDPPQGGPLESAEAPEQASRGGATVTSLDSARGKPRRR